MKISFKRSKTNMRSQRILSFIKKKTRQLSQSFVYSVLLMFYAFNSSKTPLFAKNVILGTIGYVLTPIDSIPDITPLFGFTDDLGVLSFGLVSIACYINAPIRRKALSKMNSLYKHVDMPAIEKVNASL